MSEEQSSPVMLKPSEISLHPAGLMVGTLGNGEMEFAAAAVVLYHHENSLEEWTPIKTSDFFEWVRTSEMMRAWSQNPFWRPNFAGLIDDGWVEGWTMDGDKEARMAAVGVITPKFIEAVSNPRIGPKERHAKRVHS